MKLRRAIVICALAVVGAVVFAVTALGGSGAPANTPLFADLAGGSEVGAEGQANAGDANGRGAATVVVVGPTRICYSIVVSGIAAPVAAHIHRGAAGIAGPVAVTLEQPEAGNPGTSSGCVTAPRGVVSALQRNPGNWYVNVHTADYPGGAVRGQLF